MSERAVARVLSVQVGKIRPLGQGDKVTRSAFVKTPVPGPVRVTSTTLEGDQQADRRWHGGPEMAVLGYAASHYPLWIGETSLPLTPGGFGENLTIDPLTEATVAIGDVHRIGTARLQIAQHRGPCSKIEKRWCTPGLVERVLQTARCGWYYRVLTEGELSAGDSVILENSPNPELTLEKLFQARYAKAPDPGIVEAFVRCPELTLEVREELQGRL